MTTVSSSTREPVPFTPSQPLPAPKPGAVQFPAGFSWGAATAAYQVEGAAAEDGRRDSIWDTFCRIPGAILGGEDGTVACDEYHRYREDVALIAQLGLDTYRFSTSWARVMPEGRQVNPAGLDYYSRLVDELLGAGITPWLTLYHWDLPQVLQDEGGWPARDTAHRFAEYAAVMHEALGDRVRIWTTLNEPWCAAFLGYTAGVHAPGGRSGRDGVAAAHHLLLGHGLALDELRRRDSTAQLGLTLNFTVADPADPDDAADVNAARIEDGLFNRFFLDPLFTGAYPPDVLEDVAHLGLQDHIQPGDLDLISAPIDVLGVNFYNGAAVSARPEEAVPEHAVPEGEVPEAAVTPETADRAEPAVPEGTNRPDGVRSGDEERSRDVGSPNPVGGVYQRLRGLPTTGMGWEVQPEGLARLLTRLHRDYTGPAGACLYVTENGAAYPDEVAVDGTVYDPLRIEYLDAHLRAVAEAIDAGADVRGYLLWSLLDNFEWALGYSQRFGIVRVDYATQERTIKSSGRWYAQVAATRRLPAVGPDRR